MLICIINRIRCLRSLVTRQQDESVVYGRWWLVSRTNRERLRVSPDVYVIYVEHKVGDWGVAVVVGGWGGRVGETETEGGGCERQRDGDRRCKCYEMGVGGEGGGWEMDEKEERKRSDRLLDNI